ncbi:MAG TPA: DsbE family thiol:disulfide interchange protein [Gammaproteobacteria bacterium]|nr:DsbE family thiol:disulfide interchange protein [Gammaproteobacteria bacterium]HBX26795.1 DsbE family thiol:disulfide interchange protein [Gammaproteobacteria bacterium]
MSRWVVWAPLGVFVVLVGFFFKGLTLDPSMQPSALIGKPVPSFQLTDLHTGKVLTSQTLPGVPFLLNVWASWCITCQVEHPYLTELSDQVPIVGLNYKDSETAAKNWLAKLGDPYTTQIFDPNGRLGLDLGVAGAPETFLVDSSGVIQLRIQGEVNDRVYQRQILPLLETLK